ncbi:hypothetical protein HZC08_02250 [Candidatus Micrarchaeota archaeon]|nr:hypothetical protein [Candidatus Micrarchaeota archaeon]
MCPPPRQVSIEDQELRLLRKVVLELRAEGYSHSTGSVQTLDRFKLLELIRDADPSKPEVLGIIQSQLDTVYSSGVKSELSTRIKEVFPSKISSALERSNLESLRRIATALDGQHFASASRQELDEYVGSNAKGKGSQKDLIKVTTKEQLLELIKGYFRGEPEIYTGRYTHSFVSLDEDAKREILKIFDKEVRSLNPEERQSLLELLKREKVYLRTSIRGEFGTAREAGTILRPPFEMDRGYASRQRELVRPVKDTLARIDSLRNSLETGISENLGSVTSQIPLDPEGKVDFNKLEEISRKKIQDAIANLDYLIKQPSASTSGEHTVYLEKDQFDPDEIVRKGAAQSLEDAKLKKAELEALLSNRSKMSAYLKKEAAGVLDLKARYERISVAFSESADVLKETFLSEVNQPIIDALIAKSKDAEIAAAFEEVGRKVNQLNSTLNIGEGRSLKTLSETVGAAERDLKELHTAQKNLITLLKRKEIELPEGLEKRIGSGLAGIIAFGLVIAPLSRT